MNWRAALTVSVLVGLGSAGGVVCAKELRAFEKSDSAAPSSDEIKSAALPVGVASFSDVAPGRSRAPRDPAVELLASNPYEAQLNPYRKALDIDGEHPLLEDPYEETKRFVNPYENTVGVANPYVDLQRESEMQRQARLANPYTERLREEAAYLQNPYARRR